MYVENDRDEVKINRMENGYGGYKKVWAWDQWNEYGDIHRQGMGMKIKKNEMEMAMHVGQDG